MDQRVLDTGLPLGAGLLRNEELEAKKNDLLCPKGYRHSTSYTQHPLGLCPFQGSLLVLFAAYSEQQRPQYVELFLDGERP